MTSNTESEKRAVRFLNGSRKFASALIGIAGLAIASLAPTQAYADVFDDSSGQAMGNTGLWLPGSPQVINIWDVNQSGQTLDNTIFAASPNPTQPSTGTGVFQPFLREQRGSGQCGSPDNSGNNDCTTVHGDSTVGVEAAFNSDEKGGGAIPINFDAKDPRWTHSVLMSDVAKVTDPITHIQYIVLSLDANEVGQAQTDANKIVLSQMEIFIAPGLTDPETSCHSGIQKTGYSGQQYDNNPSPPPGQADTLCGNAPVWSLDNPTNGDVDVTLQASICDTKGQCGSGKGDLDVFIPVSLLGPAAGIGTNDFVLYAEFLYASDGFEEWRFSPSTGCCSFVLPTPEPGTLAMFGFGLAGLGLMRRRKKPVLAQA